MNARSALQESFVRRLERHRKVLFKIANAYCSRPSDRDDLVSEMVVQLWRSYERYDERYAFSTWMYRIALNVAISAYRKHLRERAFSAPLDEAEEVAVIEPGERDVKALLDFIALLEPIDRALMLAYLDGYKHREIAEMLGFSETNVATKLSRLRDRLRSMHERALQKEEING